MRGSSRRGREEGGDLIHLAVKLKYTDVHAIYLQLLGGPCCVVSLEYPKWLILDKVSLCLLGPCGQIVLRTAKGRQRMKGGEWQRLAEAEECRLGAADGSGGSRSRIKDVTKT